MAGNGNESLKEETGVVLGFLEEAETWELQSSQFPSKVYAPIVGQDRSFHRTLFVFCCKTPECYSPNDNRCFKVYRSQLPRKNDFYSYDPPSEEEPGVNDSDPDVLQSGLKLCRVCGCPGSKSCSRCHAANYCSKDHQIIDWKSGHKNECGTNATPCSADFQKHEYLFPEFELLTEPEKVQGKETPSESDDTQKTLESITEDGFAFEDRELEEMAMHETEDSRVFQKFKQKTELEPHQVLRYCRTGSALWVSAQHIPKDKDIPACPCGAKRIFEFQVMPQLLNHLKVDGPHASIDWGTLAVYTCEDSCGQGYRYSSEFIWKQDFTGELP